MHDPMLSRPGERSRPASLWRHPGFFKLCSAVTVSRFGSEVTALALPLLAALILDATPVQMGLLSAAATAPFLLFGLFVGVWVDRVRRGPLLVVSDLARAALLVAVPVSWSVGHLSMGLLYAVAFGVGTLTVVFEVASLSLLPTLIGPGRLVEANGRLEAGRSLAQIGAPGLAGGLIGLLGAPAAVLVDAASYLLSAAFLACVRTPKVASVVAPREPRSVAREVREGLRAVFSSPLLRPLVLCSATNGLSGFVFLSVYLLYLTNDLGLGPTSVGLVFAVGGVGALLGALSAEPIARRFGEGRTLVSSMLLCGLSGTAIPLAVAVPTVALPMVLAAEFAQWMFLVVYKTGEVSIRQEITPDRLLGRVNATERFVTYGAIPAGALLGGFLGEMIGIRLTLVAGMAGMLLASSWLLASPVRYWSPPRQKQRDGVRDTIRSEDP